MTHILQELQRLQSILQRIQAEPRTLSAEREILLLTDEIIEFQEALNEQTTSS
jgi:hypothetical protein